MQYDKNHFLSGLPGLTPPPPATAPPPPPVDPPATPITPPLPPNLTPSTVAPPDQVS